MNHLPQAFTGSPNHAIHHPAPTPVTQVVETGRAYAPRGEACATVRRDGRVYLNAEAARLIPASQAAVELLHPVRARDNWRLDTRQGGRCNLGKVGNTGGLVFRAPLAAEALFSDQPPTVDGLRFLLRRIAEGLYWLVSPTVNN